MRMNLFLSVLYLSLLVFSCSTDSLDTNDCEFVVVANTKSCGSGECTYQVMYAPRENTDEANIVTIDTNKATNDYYSNAFKEKESGAPWCWEGEK